jgi:hypothetical protein
MLPEQRLNALYKKLVGDSLLMAKGSEAATKFGIKPSQQQYLKNIILDETKVYRSNAVLSRWRQSRTLPYVCAGQVAAIWS